MTMTFPLVLLTLFIALKLCGVIAWSWLWVLAPLWIPLGLALVIYAIVLAFMLCGGRR